MESVDIRVVGLPKGMGSAKAVPTNANWRNVPGVRWKVVDNSHATDEWQRQVESAAKTACFGQEPIDGPCVVQMTFSLPRPASHFGTGRNAEVLKPGAPEYPVGHGCGDLDKLVRAVGDALTGVVYVDDALIVNLHAWKRYGAPGVQITVSRIGGS
jgi:crossover junction endodeoxyribonuclease RusA